MELFGLEFVVNNQYGWFAFGSLIVLLILYFMRPQPYKKVIPSLIFLEKSQKMKNMQSFFKRFLKDWMILLQLLLLALLAVAALEPSTTLMLQRVPQDTTFVIDASASSQLETEEGRLFDIYKSRARDYIGVSNDIILAKNSPQVIARATNPINTYRLLSSIDASESLSNLWDSVMLASDISPPGSTVVVLSDFTDTNRRDMQVARQILQAKGLKVEYINPLSEKPRNVGIIDYVIQGGKAIVDVKNFAEVPMTVRIGQDTVELAPYAVEQFSVELTAGFNEISIDTDDDFSIDDTVFITQPQESTSSILYISNDQDTNLAAAIEAMDTDVVYAEPPIIDLGNPDIIIMDHIDFEKILPGTIEDIGEYVRNGGSLIVAAQKDMSPDILGELLPVSITFQESQMEIQATTAMEEFSDFPLGLSSAYLRATLKNNDSIVLANAADEQDSPTIVLSQVGRGRVFYYGVLDEYNQFKLTPQYPLFWINAVSLLSEKNEVVNRKIGDIIYGENIQSPDGNTAEDYIVAESIGRHRIGDQVIAVSLLNAAESDIQFRHYDGGQISRQKVPLNVSLVTAFIALGIFVSLLEIYILKRRGDL